MDNLLWPTFNLVHWEHIYIIYGWIVPTSFFLTGSYICISQSLYLCFIATIIAEWDGNCILTVLTNLGALFLISALTIILHVETSIRAQEDIHFYCFMYYLQSWLTSWRRIMESLKCHQMSSYIGVFLNYVKKKVKSSMSSFAMLIQKKS